MAKRQPGHPARKALKNKIKKINSGKRQALKKRAIKTAPVKTALKTALPKRQLKGRSIPTEAVPKIRRGISPKSPTLHVMGFQDDSDGLLDEITGRKRKSSSMHILNKKRVSKWEMDELFGDFDY